MTRLLLLAFTLSFAQSCHAQSTWKQFATTADAGFDAEALEKVRLRADELQSGALMIVQDGYVVAAWGDVERKFKLHSVRKSLVSALYGAEVADGRIVMTTTLADLGIDDNVNPLTDVERSATVRDLISARSGVFLPAAYAPASQSEQRPERGSHDPGAHWFYNNWDFNVAGVIFQGLTDEHLYQAFDERIAHPVGMEDYHPRDGFEVFEPNQSEHPAHTFRMSTRDLARFGWLYANQGVWRGKEVVPASWVKESTAAQSDFGTGRGYGYMWWTHEPGHLGDDYMHADQTRSYMARGTGGQVVIVYEELGLVIVHRGDTDHDRRVGGSGIWHMIDDILGAKTGRVVKNPRLTEITTVPFASQLPDDRPEVGSLTLVEVQAFVGTYRAENGMRIPVVEHQGGAYMSIPGRGQAQLFSLTREDAYTIKVIGGVKIFAEQGADERIQVINVSLGPMSIRAERVD